MSIELNRESVIGIDGYFQRFQCFFMLPLLKKLGNCKIVRSNKKYLNLLCVMTKYENYKNIAV